MTIVATVGKSGSKLNIQTDLHSPPSAFIRLLSLQYKRQDRAGNGDSERIQSVLCEDTLRVKRIIRSIKQLLLCTRERCKG